MSELPFNIELSGFGQFSAHTLFIEVLTFSPVFKIVREIRAKHQHLFKRNDQFKPVFVSKPHVTIARKMSEDQHKQAWAEWHKRKLNASFIAGEMILLKRKIDENNLHPAGHYQIVKIFPFEGRTKQEAQLQITF